MVDFLNIQFQNILKAYQKSPTRTSKYQISTPWLNCDLLRDPIENDLHRGQRRRKLIQILKTNAYK